MRIDPRTEQSCLLIETIQHSEQDPKKSSSGERAVEGKACGEQKDGCEPRLG
jgi:hypothetical protein